VTGAYAGNERPAAGRRSAAWVATAVLAGTFAALYLFLGTTLGRTGVFGYQDALFGADVDRVIYDMTAAGADHSYTTVHPLFVLFLNPAGALLTKVLGSRVVAAVTLNAAAGGLCVALAHRFFRRVGAGLVRGILYAFILGSSSAHLFYGAVPETWIFTACGITLLFLLLASRPGKLRYFVPAGIFALGTLTTNVFHVVATYAAGLFGKERGRALWGKLAAYFGAVLSGTVALSLVQRWIFPRAKLFFLPLSWTDSLTWYSWRLGKPAELPVRLVKLLAYHFVYNFASPGVEVSAVPAGKALVPRIPYVGVDPLSYDALGFVAAALGVLLAGAAAASFFKNKVYRDNLARALIIVGVFGFLMFGYYGSGELFVYTPMWTFVVLAGGALSAEPFFRRGGWKGRVATTALVVFAGLQLVNNLRFFYGVVDVFQRGLPPMNW
jgi:hypothetical protein